MRNGTWDQLLTVTQAKMSAPGGADRKKVAIDLLEANPEQPRQLFEPEALAELASSIKTHGVLQPLLVRPHPKRPHAYQIVAGERRYRAAREAGLVEVPVVVRELSDTEALELALVENVLREDISPLEEARTLKALLDAFGYSYAQLGERLGKNKAYVDHRVRLLKMPTEIQQALDRVVLSGEEGKIRRPFSPRHAGIVSQLEAEPLRQALIDQIFAEQLSVAETQRRKGWLKEAAHVAAPEARERLESAIVAGLSDKDAKFRLSAFQAPAEAPDAVSEPSRVAIDALALTRLIDEARSGDGTVSVAALLKAMRSDRRQLER